MNEQQLQQAFIQFLAQKTGAKTQQELEAAIQQLGEQGLQQAYQEFMQLLQQQQVQAAKFGAKLNYIKELRGQCPEGYEIQYYKSGGHLCKKCMKKQVLMLNLSGILFYLNCRQKQTEILSLTITVLIKKRNLFLFSLVPEFLK